MDLIGFYFLIFLHAMVFDAWLGVVPEEGSDSFVVYFFIFFVAYHLLFEYFFGKTPGKFLTGTKVIDENGNKPDFKTLLIRNASRLIPFDALSFLFSERGGMIQYPIPLWSISEWRDLIASGYLA